MQLVINLCSFNKWTYLLSSQMKRTRWMDTDLFCLNWKSKQGKVESCWQAVSQLQRSGVGTYLPFWWPEASLHSSGHRNYKVVTHPASSLVQCKWKFAGLDRWSTHRGYWLSCQYQFEWLVLFNSQSWTDVFKLWLHLLINLLHLWRNHFETAEVSSPLAICSSSSSYLA